MIYSIQFLRGVAALIVVMAHIKNKGYQFDVESFRWLNIGSSGVDLFFIISGFIMCHVTHDKPTSFISFITGRVKRIIPTYWILSFFAMVAFFAYPSMINSSGGETSIISSFTLIPDGKKYLIQNGWTLSYEFFFYIIFSIFIALTEKRALRYVGISLSILALIASGIAIKTNNPLFSFSTNSLLLEFILGILCFLVVRNVKINSIACLLLVLFGVALLTARNEIMPFSGPRVIYFGVPMAILFTGIVGLESCFLKCKSYLLKIIESLGDVSYSLYLTHPFSLVVIAKVLTHFNIKNPYSFGMLMLASSLLSGVVFYIFIERPIAKKIKDRT